MRVGGTALLLIVAAAPPATAQAPPHLDVSLGAPGEVLVSVRNLLATDAFLDALESGFPLYMEYRVRLRAPRALWDRTVDELILEYVVVHDPVRERYVVETPDATEILPDRQALRERVASVYVFRGLMPDGPGSYYYDAVVSARTLSDEDVNEAFAWLKGENGDSARLRDPGLVTRTARRLLMQVAPLPRLQLEGRTANFSR